MLGFKSGQVVTGRGKPYVGQSADVIGNMAGSITSRSCWWEGRNTGGQEMIKPKSSLQAFALLFVYCFVLFMFVSVIGVF